MIRGPFPSVVSVVLVLFYCSTSFGAAGLQGCLEAYQKANEQIRARIDSRNQGIQQRSELPKMDVLPQMRGPLHYYQKSEHDVGYVAGTVLSAGTLPFVHWAAKGLYQIPRYGIPAAVNGLAVAPTNAVIRLRKRLQRQDYPLGYEQEIKLIKDFMQLTDLNQIMISKGFQRISQDQRVSSRYTESLKIFEILRTTFERQLICREGNEPFSFERIITVLEDGTLAQAIQPPGAFSSPDDAAEKN